MTQSKPPVNPAASSGSRLANLRAKVAEASQPLAGDARFMIAFDATGSRAPTWEAAQSIQTELFAAVAESGAAPAVRLSYFCGDSYRATSFTTNYDALLKSMRGVQTSAGITQIERVLKDAISQAQSGKVSAVLFTGDCMEENKETLFALSAELGRLNVPVYMFQEGSDWGVRDVYRQISETTGGKYAAFKSGAFNDLRSLFKVVVALHAGNLALLDRVKADKTLTGEAVLMLSSK